MKRFLLAFTLAFFGFSFALAAPSNLTFTTDPQSVMPGTPSDKLTVSTGEAVGETSDLFLTSSSATGEFSSSNTNWQPVSQMTWNSNWTNRTFYYRDTTEGAPTITAKLVTRTSQTTLIATQAITIGAGGGGSGNTDSSEEETSSGSSGTSNVTLVKTTSSKVTSKSRVEIPSLAPVQTPVVFKVKSGAEERGTHYYWSFGDGAVTRGLQATHLYDFPGTYVVALTARRGDEATVLKSEIEIVEAKLGVSKIVPGAQGYIELENQTGKELNLEHWQLVVGERTFSFPGPTYLAAKQKLKLPARITGLILSDEEAVVRVNYPSQAIAMQHEPVKKVVAQAVEQAALVALVKPKVVVSKQLEVNEVSKESLETPVPAPAETKAATKTVIIGETKASKTWWQRLFAN